MATLLEARKNVLLQPAPILEFWDVTTPEGNLYFVDFAESDGPAPTSTIVFDGQVYWPVKITRGEIRGGGNAETEGLEVSILDPSHAIVGYLRRNKGLVNEKVTLRIIPFDRLSVPTDARIESFRIREMRATQGPDRVTAVLGFPNLFGMRTPHKQFVRNRCFNDYSLRVDSLNPCNYPSDRFQDQTRQNFHTLNSVATLTARRFGWSTLNADRPTIWDTGYTLASKIGDLVLHCETGAAFSDKRWKDAVRLGPYVFKSIPNGDFDCFTRVASGDLNANGNWLCGILIQDPTAESNWLFWCAYGAGDSVSVFQIRARVTTAGVSVDENFSVSPSASARDLRVERVGDSFKLYDAPINVAWTLRTTKTVTLPSTVRVGIVLASDTQSTDVLAGDADYLLFLKGGLPTCNRSFADCTLHGQTHQFNGFLAMPEQISSVL
jgi:hypothetical protein